MIFTSKTSMHIDAKHHFIQDIVAQEQIIVGKVYSCDNSADMLTKSLSNTKFRQCLGLVGVV